MKIINKEYVDIMKRYNLEYNLKLSNYECECYANMFNVLNEVASNQFTFEQLFDTYNFFIYEEISPNNFKLTNVCLARLPHAWKEGQAF